jgi:ribosomal protein S18 acetylase RimI-like enzyme
MRVRRVEAGDREGWDRLYAGYAEFYGVAQTDGMRDRVWGWLHDPAHETMGFVAERDGALVGLAHVRPYARPLAASVGGFLDDLFVAPEARGSGAAEALIRAAAEHGRREGWTKLRWITAQDNARARKLYDRLAVATPWVTYDLDL